MSDYTVVKGQPTSLTFTAGAAIAADPFGRAVIAGQLVQIAAAGTVGPAAAASTAYVGVAGNDAPPGGLVTVLCGAGVIHETPAAAAIAVADPVQCGAAGVVATAAVGFPTVGVAVRAGDPAAVPPVPCRWLAWR